MAAMTPNSNLRSNLVRRAHDRASVNSLYGNQSMGAYPVRYDSTRGGDISGITSCFSNPHDILSMIVISPSSAQHKAQCLERFFSWLTHHAQNSCKRHPQYYDNKPSTTTKNVTCSGCLKYYCCPRTACSRHPSVHMLSKEIQHPQIIGVFKWCHHCHGDCLRSRGDPFRLKSSRNNPWGSKDRDRKGS